MGELHENNIKPEAPRDSFEEPEINVSREGSEPRPDVAASQAGPDLDTALRAYADSDFCPMHMPGHKRRSIEEIANMSNRNLERWTVLESPLRGRGMSSGHPLSRRPKRSGDGREVKPEEGLTNDLPVERMDITEIDGFDNLHRPEGLIADIEGGLADLYHVPAAKLSVGGSTVGLLSAITAVTKPGDRILIGRNCHAAVYHAALVQGLQVDYLLPEADGSIAAATVADAFENNALARMINALAAGKLQDILDGVGRPDNFESNTRSKSTEDRNDTEQPIGAEDRGRVRNASPYKAVILTCPTYEGMISDIAAIAKIVHAHGAVLIVDAAHGAHLGISDQPIFPENPIHCGADIAVVSLHKTLPALTMTAAILLAPSAACGHRKECASREVQAGGETAAGGENPADCRPSDVAAAGGQNPVGGLLSAVASALDIYETSSPSYVLMASVARMLRLLKTDGEALFARYADRLQKFYADAAALKDPAVLGADSGFDGPGQGTGAALGNYAGERRIVWKDPSKIVIVSKNDIINRLRTDYHIELEMASLSYALAMTSIADSDENFERLFVALEDMNRKRQAAGGESVTQKFNQAEGRSQDSRLRSALAGFPRGVFTLDLPFVSEDYKLPEAVMDIRTAYFSDAEEIPLAAAVGRVSASFVSVFPPEIPLLVPGERIGEPEVSLLQVAAGRGFTVHGLNSGRIKVVR